MYELVVVLTAVALPVGMLLLVTALGRQRPTRWARLAAGLVLLALGVAAGGLLLVKVIFDRLNYMY